ncbi:DUF4091 domain-containing protein [Polaribacter batillariae]|uniref:DUF4091 domain-containing protein n=1 Tax=Polaribacter batillariae TaxID=2808900 RepID=A0ABX7SXJ8_9FLAO|nr:glycoside hydrolase domain-containing protein [Polaribacter batillariae]QTD38979.1 DUF4091 domain-containing protein [Polaribacter batillariae]
MLWSNSDINGLSYNISDFQGGSNKIDNSNIKLRFGKYIKGDPESRTCSRYPTRTSSIEIIDALIEEEITSITPTDPLKLWVTIDVPKNTSIGVYNGTITVNGATNSLNFDISIQVVDYTLPDVPNWSFHLDLWQFPVNILNHFNTSNPSNKIRLWSDEHFNLIEPFYKHLADSGQKSITTYIKEDALGATSMIKWIKKIDGTWEYDFTVFDKYVGKLMSWGITKQISCFSPVGWNEEIIPYWDKSTNTKLNLSAPLNSTAYSDRWEHFLTEFKLHLDSKGWFDKSVLYLDEVSEDKLDRVVSVVKGNNQNWKLGIAYSHGLTNASKSNFYDLSGILEDASNEGITGNKISTFYTSCTQLQPNNYITPENSPAEMSWMPWYAFNKGFKGYLRWAYDYWQKTDPFDARDGAHTAGDFSMVYRASNNRPSTLITSIRLELLREGIQDFEKLNILKTSLEVSSDLYDKEILEALNTIISKFTINSGSNSKQLVIEGQKAIKEISLGTFSYCKVNGNVNEDYFVSSLTTENGNNNINYSTNFYPNTGYKRHTSSKVSVLPGASFIVNLTNSSASNCARTKVWIDWNNDEDFDDIGEEVFEGGASNTCNNGLAYTIPVTVPNDVFQGIKRMRVQVKNSFELEPKACGTNDKSSTTDFDIEVLDAYCSVSGTGNYNANKVITSGGILNINYNGGSGTNNYMFSDQKIITTRSSTFNLSVTNSNGWSRSLVWIDWNGDNDFDDLNEKLAPLSEEKVSQGTTPSYSIEVTVPPNAKHGVHKIRIVTGDAWTYEDSAIPDTPCGIPTPDGSLENAAIKDFFMEITSGLSYNSFEKNLEFSVYPNPVKKYFIIESSSLSNRNVNLKLANYLGQIVLEKYIPVFQSPQKIYLPNKLMKGIYLLKITVNNNEYYSKLLKV